MHSSNTLTRDSSIQMIDDYLSVCRAEDIPNGGRKCTQIADENILLFNIDREFFAVKNLCTHLAFPLEDGRHVGTEIICRQHGARFDICSGEVLGGPAVLNLKTYPVRVVDGEIQVKV